MLRYGALTWHRVWLLAQVLLGTCPGFKLETEFCKLQSFLSDPGTCEGEIPGSFNLANCRFDILEENGGLTQLIEMTIYYITVLATNEVGRGYLTQAPFQRHAWKLFPTFIVPLLEEFPLRVVEWEGESYIWWRGISMPQIPLVIKNLARREIGQRIRIPVTFGGPRGNASTLIFSEVTARFAVLPGIDLQDDEGLLTATTLRFNPPVFGLGEGYAEAYISIPEYPDRYIIAGLSYFEYELAELIRVAPFAGPKKGNTLVSIEIREDIGLETRVEAGLPNALQATVQNSQVTFNGTRAFIMDVVQVRFCYNHVVVQKANAK